MKYIKYFLESQQNYLEDYGLYPEDIKDMFWDLEEEGYNISVNFFNKLVKKSEDFNDLKFVVTPFIEVKIKKTPFGFMTRAEIVVELQKLIESELFKETIEVATNRLKDKDWSIKEIKKEEDYLSISICKINI